MMPNKLTYNRADGKIRCGAIELAEVYSGPYLGENHDLGDAIAAAPALLVALEKLIADVDREQNSEHGFPSLKEAKEAVAKARGTWSEVEAAKAQRSEA